jgi:hypothetical protein
MVTRNLATQIEIYNGATGTLVGFGFHTAIPEENFPTLNTFQTLQNRELPVVFVKLDTYTGTQLSTDVDKQILFHLQKINCSWNTLHALATSTYSSV